MVADTVPKYTDLMNPTLEAISSSDGSASIKEIAIRVVEIMNLLPEVVEVPHGNGRQTELEYRLAWARTYLKQFGLINNSERGIWSLTSSGRNTDAVDPEEVKRTVIEQRRNARQSLDAEVALATDEEETITVPSEEMPPWKEELLDTLQTIPPEAFERLCILLLRESEFVAVKRTGKSGDGGIDGHGIIRLAGLISFPVMFQSKRYKGKVGAGAVRDFRGAMAGRADKGMILTTGTFTMEAQREATRDGAPPIDLIDGGLLADILKKLRLGVTTRTVEVTEISTEFFSSI